MANLEKMIQWMIDRKGKVTYSMTARLGPTSYDCSSAVYLALINGGFLPPSTMGNTDTLFEHLEKTGWKPLQAAKTGNYPAKKGDIFIWGTRGASSGASGHTGIFIDDQDQIIHCNYGSNGITVNDHDFIWELNGRPAITIYRYDSLPNTAQPTPKPGQPKPQSQVANLIAMTGIFYPDRQLAVSADTNPDDYTSPALDYYSPGMAIRYDYYIHNNGYVWISYVSSSGIRRYVAVGPDDGRVDTTWGTGFFNQK